MQQATEHEAGRPRSNDSDLRAHHLLPVEYAIGGLRAEGKGMKAGITCKISGNDSRAKPSGRCRIHRITFSMVDACPQSAPKYPPARAGRRARPCAAWRRRYISPIDRPPRGKP